MPARFQPLQCRARLIHRVDAVHHRPQLAAREPQLARVRAKVAAEKAGDRAEAAVSRSSSNFLAMLKVPLVLLVVGGLATGGYFLFFGQKMQVTGTMATFSEPRSSRAANSSQ